MIYDEWQLQYCRECMSLLNSSTKMKLNLHVYRCHAAFNLKETSAKPQVKRSFEVCTKEQRVRKN